jgi:hypothetical protein
MIEAPDNRDYAPHGVTDEYLSPAHGKAPRRQPVVRRGPSLWLAVKNDPAQYGPEHDFEILEHEGQSVFWPVSNACLQWCYFVLPENIGRFSNKGFIIDSRHIGHVVKAAQRDNLMSRDDYEAAQENEQTMLQGESNDIETCEE